MILKRRMKNVPSLWDCFLSQTELVCFSILLSQAMKMFTLIRFLDRMDMNIAVSEEKCFT